MNYLIDTHILLWYMIGDKRIAKKTQSIIENRNNNIYVSNASLWEIAIKISIGKLKLNGSLKNLENYLVDMRFGLKPVFIALLDPRINPNVI